MDLEEYSLIRKTRSSYDRFHIDIKCSCGYINYIPDNGKDAYCDMCRKKLRLGPRRCCMSWLCLN